MTTSPSYPTTAPCQSNKSMCVYVCVCGEVILEKELNGSCFPFPSLIKFLEILKKGKVIAHSPDECLLDLRHIPRVLEFGDLSGAEYCKEAKTILPVIVGSQGTVGNLTSLFRPSVRDDECKEVGCLPVCQRLLLVPSCGLQSD